VGAAAAVQWAHQVEGRFPDGQLYVNLRGYDRDEPVSTADALAGFLRALGVPGTDIPDEVGPRARMYRSRLAGRRVLVLLDNAKDSDQVRPLLPGDPGCVAVVTSRDSLAGLVAADGARRLDLDVLPLADAIALLRSLIGGRVDEDPVAAAGLAGLCAGLPLALRIAAERAAAPPEASLADLVAELAAAQLDGLTAGDDRADVRTVFSWSFCQLPPDAADAFVLIGLHPGADLDAHAAAALTRTGTEQARQVLRRLLRANLLMASGTSRYGMHDLLRAYAREQAAAHDTGCRCQQALTGLFDYYLAGAAAAMNTAVPAEAHWRPSIPPSAAAVPAMPGEQDALAWLDAERANLAAVAAHCADHGWPRHATDLTATLFRYLTRGGYLPEATSIYRHIMRLARTSGDLAAEADAQRGLGGVNMMKGHFSEAIDNHRAALDLYRRCGNRLGEARVLHNLGMTEHNLHDVLSATDHYRQAIAAYKDVGDNFGVARVLVDVASAAIELASPDEAAEHAQLALQLCRENNDHAFEAEALERLGDLSLGLRRLSQAAEYFEQALAIHRRIGLPNGITAQLRGLEKVRLHQREYQDAISYLQEALEIYRETGNKHGEIKTLLVLAAARHGDGQIADGRTELETAIRLAAETGNTYRQANAHSYLAESHHRSGQNEQACHHWHQALTLYTQLGATEADQIRERLTASAVLTSVSDDGDSGAV
jgi:tetratricopeptide (TPR) repeat protein